MLSNCPLYKNETILHRIDGTIVDLATGLRKWLGQKPSLFIINLEHEHSMLLVKYHSATCIG